MNFADETWVHCPVTKNKNKPECTFSSLSGKMEASRIAFWTQYFHIARSKHNRVQEHLFRYSGYVRGLIIWLHMPPSQKSFSPIFFLKCKMFDLLCTRLLTVIGSTGTQLYISLARMLILPSALLLCLIYTVVSEIQPYIITITFLGYYITITITILITIWKHIMDDIITVTCIIS